MIHALLGGLSELQLFIVLFLTFLGYLFMSFLCWYILYAIDCSLNSGQLGRHPILFPFECFIEELPCRIRNGKQARIDFIKKLIGDEGDGSMCGSKRSYRYEEIRENNLHEEVFFNMLGGHFGFWSMHLLYFALWPVALCIVVVMIVVVVIIAAINSILSIILWFLRLVVSMLSFLSDLIYKGAKKI